MTTGHTPFKIIYNYNLKFIITFNSSFKVLVADEQENEIKKEMLNERMKCFYDRSIKDAP